jgi:adenine-specific DNA methylase
MGDGVDVTTTGWRPTCAHDAAITPSVVLDPFAGSGTVGVVAQKLGRRAVLVELSLEYCDLAKARLEKVPMPMGVANA